MECEVEFTDEFESWWNDLLEDEQDSVRDIVELLRIEGTSLKFPYTSGIAQSEYTHMRELRIQHRGRPYRVLYAFDPRRSAMLLIGGDKTGANDWYNVFVPVADRLYGRHLMEIGKAKGS